MQSSCSSRSNRSKFYACFWSWPRENSALEFRSEFFNAFNHPQFCDPDVDFTSPTFGQIFCTSVAPRIIQFALKLQFLAIS